VSNHAHNFFVFFSCHFLLLGFISGGLLDPGPIGLKQYLKTNINDFETVLQMAESLANHVRYFFVFFSCQILPNVFKK